MELFFSTRGGRASCLRACLDAMLLPQSLIVTTRLHVTNRAACLHGLGQGQLFLLAYICSSDNANGKVRYFNTQLHLGQAFRNRNSSSSSFEMVTLFFLCFLFFFFFFFFLHLDLYLSKTYSGQREVNQVK